MDGGWAPLMGREVYSRQIMLSLFDFKKNGSVNFMRLCRVFLSLSI